MRKSLIKIGILLLIVCLSLSSCQYAVALLLSQEVKYVEDATIPTLLYDGNKYVMEINGWFNGTREFEYNANTGFNGVLLGMRPGLYAESFFSYTYENPLYIYSNSCNAYFFREDYDPKEDSFLIEGTKDSIPLTAIMAEPAKQDDAVKKWYYAGSPSEAIVTLHSETFPQLKMRLQFAFVEGEWCFCCGNASYGYDESLIPETSTLYWVTDEFREFLVANNLLPDSPPES